MLQTTILHYSGGCAEDLATILNAADTQGLIDTVVGLLRSSNLDYVQQTCVFIRDSVLIAPEHGLGSEFREAFHTSAIVPELERLVLASGYFLRNSVIHTLGKTGCIGSLPTLGRAFHHLLEHDPLVLPELLLEIGWLEGILAREQSSTLVDAMTTSESRATQARDACPLIDAMTASACYTTRWAATHVLGRWRQYASLNQIERLRGDGHVLVRTEAEYVYRRFLFAQRSSRLSKPERKRQLKEIEHDKPPVSFFDMRLQFQRHLLTHHQISYSIEDLDRFITAWGDPRSTVPGLVE
jgi:hypothetical protein